jgi:predicted ATPase
MLIERRAIIQKEDGWIAGEGLREIDIPDNLQGLLLARIDRLSDESKQTLRVASVVGRQFPVKVLNRVLGETDRNGDMSAEDTMITLSNLESAGLIRVAQVEPDLEYLFHHNLIQEAAYTSLLVADRKRLHLVEGETEERMYPEQVDSREFAPRLGEHFAEAGDDQRALKYYQLAGEAALASYSNAEAENNYRRGLTLACTPNQRAHLLEGLGEALNGLSRYEEAIAVWREAIDYNEHQGDKAAMARLYARAGRAAWWAGATPLIANLQQGLQLFRRSG